jgi:hypothetical protein
VFQSKKKGDPAYPSCGIPTVINRRNPLLFKDLRTEIRVSANGAVNGFEGSVMHFSAN